MSLRVVDFADHDDRLPLLGEERDVLEDRPVVEAEIDPLQLDHRPGRRSRVGGVRAVAGGRPDLIRTVRSAGYSLDGEGLA